jgi:osmotically-inducible protein OsmY
MITDLSIQADIEKELRWDPAVVASHIAVTVKNGAADLLGDVDSFWEKAAATRAAWRVAHVKAVSNHLRVDLPFPSERSDDDIALAAMSILEWNCAVPDTVELQVSAATLTLSGPVPWHYQKEAAELALTTLTGLRDLKNEITIQPPASLADPRPPIEDALKRSALVDASHIKVHASHGLVNLKGTVRSKAEHDDALRAAWSAPGVAKVEDHIAIG